MTLITEAVEYLAKNRLANIMVEGRWRKEDCLETSLEEIEN
jgi:hypothetical protein